MKNKIAIKEILKKSRHPYERKLVVVSCVLSIAIYIFAGYALLVASNSEVVLNKLSALTGIRGRAYELIIRIGGPVVLLFLVFTLIRLALINYTYIGESSSSSPRLSQTKYKEVIDIYNKLIEKLEIKKAPEVYVSTNIKDSNYMGITMCSNDAINIDAKLVKDAYRNKDFSMVEYELVRRLAYIYLGYFNMFSIVLTLPVRSLPYIKELFGKVICYSVDKFAGNVLGKEKVATIIYEDNYDTDCFDEQADINQIINELIEDTKECEKKGRLLYNIEQIEPLPVYRLTALVKDKPGKIF